MGTVEANRVYGLECRREASYRERSFKEMLCPLNASKIKWYACRTRLHKAQKR